MTPEESAGGTTPSEQSPAGDLVDLSVIERVAAALDDQPGGPTPTIDFDPERSTQPLPARRR